MYSRILERFHQKVPCRLADVCFWTDDVKAMVSAFVHPEVDRNTGSFQISDILDRLITERLDVSDKRDSWRQVTVIRCTARSGIDGHIFVEQFTKIQFPAPPVRV